jgi:peptidylprolyl isomerase
VRSATSLIVMVGLVASLSACSASIDTEGCEATPAGGVSNSVKVTGEFGARPEISVETPTAATTTERTVVIAGDGDVAVAGDTVNVDFTLINGASGAEVTSTEYTGSSETAFPVDEAEFLVGIVKTLECSRVGSRVVGVIPPVDSFGEEGSPSLGVGAGEDIIFVVDIVSIAPPVVAPLSRAEGEAVAPTEGFPTVVLAEDGRPTVTIPDAAPPTDLQLAQLIQGDGAVVVAGNNVVVHYEGINWNTGVIFDESWARGEPATFNTNAVIAGFTAALVGQKVGSQVIVIIPPDQGYGEAGSPPDIGGTDTLVFVVDILGIA